MKDITKKMLIGILSLSLVAPISVIPDCIPNINASAKTRTHQYKRVHKRRATHKHKRHKRIIRRKRIRTAKHRSPKIKLISFSSQMAYQTLKDINNDRRSHGVAPIKETNSLNRLANVRARQLTHNFSHYDNYGRTYYKQDAKKMKINLIHYHHNRSTSGENIADAGLNYGNIIYTNMPNNPHKYVNKNGYDMANMDEDSMLNYDSDSSWGHRKNILSKNFRYIGIGVARKGDQYYLAEDFDS